MIADILATADALSVLTDKFEEIGPEARQLTEKCARLAADSYETAGLLLEAGEHALNAREAFDKAVKHYERARDSERAGLAQDRRIYNRPDNGNIYGW
jgi:outer membrane murein-binding lipoprotein Lpp